MPIDKLTASYDLDPSRQSEEEIAVERRFRLVVEAAPNAMVMINRAGEVVMVNAQAERVFGYSRAELLGQPVEMLVPERFRSHHPGMRATFIADSRPRPMGAGRDLYGLKKNGSEFPVEIGLNPIETDEGTMVLSAIVDITERKLAEARLQELDSQLLHVSRLSAAGEMAAMVVHELNQPLTVISSYIELAGALLDRGGDLPLARLRNAVERAGGQAMRMGQIIRGLSAFVSRGDSEKRIEAIYRR
jgi:PAS domain S-box-containing protein